jgi:O-antigen/teichoic acid export membrane protein
VKTTWLLTTGLGSAFGVFCFILFGDWVGRLLLAEQYRSATALMPPIALGYAIYVVSSVFSRFCYIFDDTKAVLYLTVAGAVIGILVMVPAIIFGGLFGASAAVAVRFGMEMVLSIPLARRAERRFTSLRADG